MSKVAVVTDSTAYIPNELIDGYPLYSVPLQVIWGEESYRDGIDIQPVEFYTRLSTAKVMPTTSQATPMAFQQLYSTLLDQGYSVVSIHISGKLSGTLDSAEQARQALKSDKITLVDSLSAGMGLGFQALTVARAAQQGASFNECVELAERSVNHVGILFVVSTLEFLHRGGRIGGAAALVGTALNLKPILGLRDGKIVAMEKVRTFNKAQDRLLEIFAEKVQGKTPVRLASLHANAPAEAEKLLGQACERVKNSVSEAFSAGVSPVIGTHTGPGTVGLAWMAGL